MYIYLASSWRNQEQPDVLASLRRAGHTVYDFRNPEPGNTGFSWDQVRLEREYWQGKPHGSIHADKMRETLSHPIAISGFNLDYRAMSLASVCVLLLPCGRSAHLEAGWCAGQGKRVLVLGNVDEPELMYKCFDDLDGRTPIFSTVEEVIQELHYIANPKVSVQE